MRIMLIILALAILLSACVPTTPTNHTCIVDSQCATKDNLTVCLDSNDTMVLEKIMSIFEEEK
uniref:Lipoprotein n=1 Tax=viral metagenome TaxID=1070528 RepID=A0A6H2A2X4_9ZZZZ